MTKRGTAGRTLPRKNSRVTETYARLHDLIVRGRLAPGARITEAEVTTRLGVSRTPVRSAIQRLQHEGYVTVTRRGRRAEPFVSPLTQEDASEVLNIIGVIEGLGARCAAELPRRPRSRLVADLRQTNRRLKAAAAVRWPHPNVIFDLDQAFHRRLLEGAAGPRLLQLHRTIKPQADRYIRVYVSLLLDRIATSVREHEAIIRGVDRGQPDIAEQAVFSNWRNAASRLSQVIEVVGERGLW